MAKENIRDFSSATPISTPIPDASTAEPADFPEVLRTALRNKGLTAADLSRLVQREIPAFSPGNISHYLAGRSLPRHQVLTIIAQALDVDLQPFAILERRSLRPSATPGETRARPETDRLSVSDAGDAQALLQINQIVPWSLALRILQLVQDEGAA